MGGSNVRAATAAVRGAVAVTVTVPTTTVTVTLAALISSDPTLTINTSSSSSLTTLPSFAQTFCLHLDQFTSMAAAAADAFATKFYMEEKWKLSKKDGASKSCRSSSTTSSLLLRNSSSKSRSSGTSLHRSSSTTSSRVSFTRKCASLVKEQRARFYIMRRCVTMLVCWRDYSDS
ncbi:hypothetical protein Sjap_001809 [Stephania japonica]|uniref:Uncharacterized protein n=1 Tax=Stephania japonica TaxID=461633 RepID=A0AAP0PTV7_9MAGN